MRLASLGAVFVVVYRKTNVIRLSQPTFLGLLPIGGLIVSLSPLTLLGKPTVVNCAYKFVPFHIGFTFSVSCLLWKIDRAFKVYRASKQMRKSSFTNLDLYCYILGVTSVDMVLQGLALIFEKTIPQEYYTTNGQNVNSMTYKTQESVLKYNLTEVLLENFDCKTEHNSLFYLSFFEVLSSFLKIVLVMYVRRASEASEACANTSRATKTNLSHTLASLARRYGCVLAYRTRKFNPQFAESTALLMIVYTVSLVAGLLLLIITQTMVVLTRIQQMKIYAALSSYCMCFSLLAIFGPRAWQLLFYGDIHKDDLMQRTQKMQHPKRITTGGGGGAGGGGGEKRGLGQKTYSKFGSGGLCGAEQGKKAGDEGLTKKIGKTDSLGRDRRVSSVFNLRAVAMSTDVRDFFPQATPIPETEAAKETALTLSPHDRVAKL